MENTVLDIKNISKEYKLYNSEMDRLKESFSVIKKSYHKPFYALKNVNIQIKKGEKVGIIGANGAGKSTLLKIVTGVLEPSSGSVEINGKVAALLELGAGFNLNYTGRENIKLNGTLMGMNSDQIKQKSQQIIEFADIGDFIDQPVRTYSSGMFVRLAFATQIFSDPDLLIVDEALSVGDIRFQQKCYRAMDSLMENKTVVLVTHDTAAVTRFCKRVIWMNQGQVMFDGDVTEGLKKYQEYLINLANETDGTGYYIDESESLKAEKSNKDVFIPAVRSECKAKGNGKASITHCGLFNEQGNIAENYEPGSIMTIKARVRFDEIAERPLYGIQVYDRLGNVIFCANTEMLGVQLPQSKRICEYVMSIKIPDLNEGEYTISLAVANGYQQEHQQLCWIDDALVFHILKRQYNLPGLLYLSEGKVEVKNIE